MHNLKIYGTFCQGYSLIHLLGLLFLAHFTLGCASGHYYSKEECRAEHCFQISNVPFIAQMENYCGPASLAMVMNFHGANLSQEEIAEDIYEPGIEGTLSINLVLYPIKKGFEAEMYNGSFEDLKEKIKSGFPMIVLVKKNKDKDQGHYLVVWGFNELNKQVFVHSGNKKAMIIGFETFGNIWRRTDYLTVRIYPKILQ